MRDKEKDREKFLIKEHYKKDMLCVCDLLTDSKILEGVPEDLAVVLRVKQDAFRCACKKFVDDIDKI